MVRRRSIGVRSMVPVFEQLALGADGVPRPSGISSVHLIVAAFTLGVPVYRITPANAAAVQPLLDLPEGVARDVADALAAGRTVLVPERAIDLGSFAGVGYILQDEQTGSGAYLISGGFAGGGLLNCAKQLEPVFDEVLVFMLLLAILALIVWLILSAPIAAPALAGAAAAFLLFLITWDGMGNTSMPPLPEPLSS
jgi:hypothetical protein